MAIESCGKYTPCRIGSTRGVEVIDRITSAPDDGVRRTQLTLLDDLCTTMTKGSLCAMGGLTPMPVRSALRHWPQDFGVHPETPDALEASEQESATVTKLCATDSLKAFGSCRLCLVEVDGAKGTPASCTTPCGDGMVVRTRTEQVQDLRRGVMELYLSDHPTDCPGCARGNCEMQTLATTVGVAEVRYGRAEPAISTDALTEKTVIALGMPTRSVLTTCAYCGVGCSFKAEVKDSPAGGAPEVVRMMPLKAGGANEGHSCVKGRFAFGYTNHPDRQLNPMVRESIDDPWRVVSWEEAIETAAGGFRRLQEQFGVGAIGGISSSRCTNEEVYVVQKMMRAGSTPRADALAGHRRHPRTAPDDARRGVRPRQGLRAVVSERMSPLRRLYDAPPPGTAAASS